MKPKRKLIGLLLTLCLVAGFAPTIALAAETDTGKAMQLVESGSVANINGGQADNIYFGTWDGSPIKWRVLDSKTNTGDSGLFLLSDVLLGTGADGDVRFDTRGHMPLFDGVSYFYHKGPDPANHDHSLCQDVNEWQNSEAQEWCNTFYGDNFTDGEQGAVLATTKSDPEYASKESAVHAYAASDNILNGDKVFFLSAEEADNSTYGFDDDASRDAKYNDSDDGWWWLRSPCTKYQKNYSARAGLVDSDGHLSTRAADLVWAARPAFNLNLNTVLFTSAAEGGKIPAAGNGAAADAIFEISDYRGDEWKLTLLDGTRNFAVAEESISGKPGDPVTLNYTGATTYDATSAPNEYISVIIEQNGEALYYGRVAQPNAADGQIDVKIPDTLAAGEYTLKVFSEQYNGGTNDDAKLTDYASNFAPVKLTVVSGDTYTLTVDLNGGSGSAAGGKYAEGAVIQIDAGSNSDYRFSGWTSSNGGSFANASSASTAFTMPAADTTIMANWQESNSGESTTDYYRLTFETNGGGEITSVCCAEYTTVDLSDYKTTREGYEFAGWYADKELTDKITSIQLNGDKTVYASWTKKDVPPPPVDPDDETPNTVKPVYPQTGDNLSPALFYGLMFMSAAAMALILVQLKRRRD